MDKLRDFFLFNFLNPATWFGAAVYGLIFLGVTWLLVRTLRLAVNQILKRDRYALIDPGTVAFLLQLTQIIIYILAFVLYAQLVPPLRSLGTAMLAGVSIVSIVVGLAAQNTLSNLVAGISLLLYQPFRVGDWLRIETPTGTEEGQVENISLGYITLRTFDNRRIVIPNNIIAEEVTINLTATSPEHMAILSVDIGYGANIDQAQKIIQDIANKHPGVHEVVRCPVTELGDFNVQLTLHAWCPNVDAARNFEFDFYEQVKKQFDEADIEFPYLTELKFFEVGRDARDGLGDEL